MSLSIAIAGIVFPAGVKPEVAVTRSGQHSSASEDLPVFQLAEHAVPVDGITLPL